ncbi:MAG TPA: hypothetical protein VHD76_02090 [Bryobacteraceae bacterium]|jgi:hypothetical protein|nr:hypothetical protein [Bryobacteraceae bacterium]
MSRLFHFIAGGVCAAMLALPGGAAMTPAPQAPKEAAAAVPSEKEISGARAKGLVWVNPGARTYHRDGRYYGKTTHGRFMTEAEAKKAGYRAAKPSAFSEKMVAASPK